MDVEELAGHVVALIAAYGQRVGGRIGGHLEDVAVERLHRLVRQRLALDEQGHAALDRVAERPGDTAATGDLTTALLRTLREDPGFSSDVAELVVSARQGVTSGSSGPVDAHISVGKMRGSQLSLGPMTINNNRQVRFAVGGLGLAAVLVLLVLVARPRSGDESPPDSADVGAADRTTPDATSSTTTSLVAVPTISLSDVAASFRSVDAEPETWEGAAERSCDIGVVLPAYEGFVSADGQASATVYESAAAAQQYIDSLDAVLSHVQNSGDSVLCVDGEGSGISYETPSSVSRTGEGALRFEATAIRLGAGGTEEERFDWAATAVTCENLVVDGFPEALVPATVRLFPCP